jgi:hypothetical protein
MVLTAREIKSEPTKDNNIQTDSVQTSKTTSFSKIAAGAKVKKGMFNIYKTKTGSYFFEVPDTLLNRDMLVAARIVSISDNAKISAGQMRSNPVLVYFSRRDKLLFMHQPTGNSYANVNDPISVSLNRNNLTPIALTFEIASRNDKDDASVIDVTKLFSSEFDLVWPAGIGTTGKLDTKASQILDMKPFPQNVEIKSFYNYSGGKEPFCVNINYSFILLSKNPMQARLADDRVGYSAENKRKYESEKPLETLKFVNRWRIEPSEEDLEKYKKGELIVPKKQIVIFVDTVMPELWRKYVRQGIEDWNLAFKEIGFNQVIVAKDYPRDPNFDSEDIRNTCFRYITSSDANASGPSWVDPRSGEIIQGDILWWHNVIDLLQTWKFVQTAAVDPQARKKVLDEKFMGETIRYAVAHETGHVFGLQHNMRGSFAYPTDSLRSATFTQKYGTTASIMDYARSNYVAQPGDMEKGVSLTPPVMGPYDYFSIKWAYKPIFDAKTPEEELPILNKWFLENNKNPFFIFGPMVVSPVSTDPSAQSDALGNDLLKSGKYGISNLKIITKNMLKWTVSDGESFDLLQIRYDGVFKLYCKLVTLPIAYLGGVYNYPGTYGQYPAKYIPTEKITQKDALKFIFSELTTCDWLNQPEINKLIGSQTDELTKWQASVITLLLGNFVLPRIVASESLFSKNAYTLNEYLNDLDTQIWLTTGDLTLNMYDKHIQLLYIDKLISLVRPILNSNEKNLERSTNETIFASATASQLLNTKSKITALLQSQPQHAGHYRLLLNLIEKAK